MQRRTDGAVGTGVWEDTDSELGAAPTAYSLQPAAEWVGSYLFTLLLLLLSLITYTYISHDNDNDKSLLSRKLAPG